MRAFAIVFSILPVAMSEYWVCPGSEVDRFKPLATDPNVKACMEITGVNLLPAHNGPGLDKYALLCAVQPCLDLYATVKPMNPQHCRMMVGHPEFYMDAGKMVSDFEEACHIQGTDANTTAPTPSPMTRVQEPSPSLSPSPRAQTSPSSSPPPTSSSMPQTPPSLAPAMTLPAPVTQTPTPATSAPTSTPSSTLAIMPPTETPVIPSLAPLPEPEAPIATPTPATFTVPQTAVQTPASSKPVPSSQSNSDRPSSMHTAMLAWLLVPFGLHF